MGVLVSAFLLPVALICSGIAFPAMLFERVLPLAPPVEKLKWGDDRSAFHNLKNITTEFLRADAQWWSKFMSFCVLVLIVTTFI